MKYLLLFITLIVRSNFIWAAAEVEEMPVIKSVSAIHTRVLDIKFIPARCVERPEIGGYYVRLHVAIKSADEDNHEEIGRNALNVFNLLTPDLSLETSGRPQEFKDLMAALVLYYTPRFVSTKARIWLDARSRIEGRTAVVFENYRVRRVLTRETKIIVPGPKNRTAKEETVRTPTRPKPTGCGCFPWRCFWG